MSFEYSKPTFLQRILPVKVYKFLIKLFYRRKKKCSKISAPSCDLDMIENFHCSTMRSDIKETEN